MERIICDEKKYKLVSLFSGIGGIDLGFEYVGFETVWANDFDKYACQTYRENVNKNIVCGDIREEKKNIPAHDVLIGGFPCQPFSTLGKLQGFEDEEGRKYYPLIPGEPAMRLEREIIKPISFINRY